MSDIETIREALEAYVKVAKELYWEGWSSADRHAKLAQKALRLFDELVKAEPVARVAGYYVPWNVAQIIAEAVYEGRTAPVVGEATHYHAIRVLPDWASTGDVVATVNDHVFYEGVK